MRVGALLAAALTLFPAVRAQAASFLNPEIPAQPCRPTIACTAEFGPAGAVQLELGYLGKELENAPFQHSIPFLLDLNATGWLQIQLGGQGVFSQPATYFDNLSLGLKAMLLKQSDYLPTVSFSATVSVPTFAGQTGYTRITDLFFAGYVSKDFGPIHADFNLALNVWRIDGTAEPQPWAALSFSTNLTTRFGADLETYVFGSADPVATKDAGVLAALTFSPSPFLTFDAGGDVSLFRDVRSYSLFVGLTVVLANLYEQPK
ncbi:MAG TPA: hypothetical protein VH083_20645 [Myxococcales bacterium]|nr:hypothetical protein [Myxococcales bacterium]